MSIIIKPSITEKMTSLSEKSPRYGFIVEKKANKLQIRDAIEKLYGVTVSGVNTMNYIGAYKSRNTKKGLVEGRTNAYKKAVVTLKDGESIDFYSNI